MGFIVSLALESAIIGVGFFEELFIKPTPLPAIVSFVNKSLDWDANSITQKGLQVDVSPSAGTVNFSNTGAMASPFSAVGWSPHNPRQQRNAGERGAYPRTATDKGSAPAPRPSAQGENAPEKRAPATTKEAPQKEAKQGIDIKAIKARLLAASHAKVGEMFSCVMCETETAKRTDTKRFCGKKCRDDFRRITKK